MENSSIKKWAAEDRPREKMLLHGKHVLSNTELLAILIGTGTKNQSALDLSRSLLAVCGGDLNQLARLGIPELIKTNGIGPAKAITISAAIELGGRRQKNSNGQKKKILSSNDIFESLRFRLGDLNHEEFWMVSMNRANQVINERMVSEGGLSGTIADPKKIFRLALEDRATSIIVCHNHPSGNLTPSVSDKQITKKMKEAGEVLEIPLLDHLIITPAGYFSFADEGIL